MCAQWKFQNENCAHIFKRGFIKRPKNTQSNEEDHLGNILKQFHNSDIEIKLKMLIALRN